MGSESTLVLVPSTPTDDVGHPGAVVGVSGEGRDGVVLERTKLPVACLPPTQVGEPVRELLQESEGDSSHLQ